MPECVIDLLESIEIDYHDGSALTPLLSISQLRVRLLLEEHPVGEIGESIMFAHVRREFDLSAKSTTNGVGDREQQEIEQP
jgi:hypothetical protein